jgi:hypothetical protein
MTVLTVQADLQGATLRFSAAESDINRIWLRLAAEPDEHVWDGGEQMSYLDLRGRRFPLWTSEPGVGPDKTSRITFEADREGKAGGDYWTTNYPQPTSRRPARAYQPYGVKTGSDYARPALAEGYSGTGGRMNGIIPASPLGSVHFASGISAFWVM